MVGNLIHLVMLLQPLPLKDSLMMGLTPLRIALTNLAYFAGDKFGAFPPRQDTNDSNDNNDAVPSFGPAVHPYPYLTMWGDFSNLRRVIALMDGGTDYDDLSIADQTTLHTASCTLGMLAYNMEVDAIASAADPTDISLLEKVRDRDNDRIYGFLSVDNGTLTHSPKYPSLYYLFPQYNHDQIGLDNPPSSIDAQDNQVLVDEDTNGNDSLDTEDLDGDGNLDVDEDTNSNGSLDPGEDLDGDGNLDVNEDIGITGISGTASNGILDTEDVNENGLFDRDDKANEYIIDQYIYDSASNNDVNHNHIYKVVGDDNDNGIAETGEPDYTAIAIPPRPRANWILFSTISGGSSNANRIRDRISGSNTNVYTMFLDKGSYNGRELMAVRNLEIDLNLMRTGIAGTTTEVDANGDGNFTGDEDINGNGTGPDTINEYWLPAKGHRLCFP